LSITPSMVARVAGKVKVHETNALAKW
jgi:hypothetical protein